MSITRKELRLPPAQRDLVNYSVRAQDYILRQGMAGGGGASTFKTTDDLLQGQLFNSVNTQQNSYMSNCLNGGASVGPLGTIGMAAANTNVSTNISYEDASRLLPNLNKSHFHEIADHLLLPSIKSVSKAQQQTPFKGFLDTSSFSKKMRSTVGTATAQKGFDFAKNSPFNEGNAAAMNESTNLMFKEEKQKMKSSMIEHQNNSAANRMNPKILETWINETLQDAEHLDIPGVILKPEHKNPISRYGIDRLALTNSGIPNEMVDRIFRALFVYSVGFYELIKKCLQHTEKKYSIITSIWKVFSILLEYCCKTDYRMLISEISKEHKQELEKLEKEFQAKFLEQAQNERILKQNMEILSKYNEELEKERTNERQMRLKLEEEYMQNTKNHEEEVQLRLKFESKLNNMHSVHRDLETKYKRCLNEIATLQNSKEQLWNKSNSQMEEMTVLKTVRAEQESRLNYQEERLNALQREIAIKVRQVEEYEGRYTRTQDELDLTKYKHQEANKDITELKLRMDVYDSQVDGLKNEKQHLQLELKETKDLQLIYEKKCGQLMDEINSVNKEYQVSKREIIGFGEIQKEREDRIDTFKKELRLLKQAHEELDLKHGTVSIQFEKVKEQYETCRRDLDDAIEKLHITNKVRHETEVRFHEEIDKNRTLHDIIKDKEEVMGKRAQEIEDLDRRVIELERMNEALEIKKAGVERQYDLTKKQLNEKINSLNDVLSNEKETRETWIERYEKEQREHTATNAQLLQTKSAHKDAVLQTKNAEIKLNTQGKANEVLTESNLRLQDQLNESLAQNENLERELNTQKEIMKQMEIAKKEYIQKLKRELETVETRFHKIIDLNTLTSEDHHSRAQENLFLYKELSIVKKQLDSDLAMRLAELDERNNEIVELKKHQQRMEMQGEEWWGRLCAYDQERVALTGAKNLLQMKCENLQNTNKSLKADNEVKSKYQNDYNEVLKELAKLKKEMNMNNKQSKGSLQGRAGEAGNRAPSTHAHYVEKKDAFCQTTIQGANIDQALMNAHLQSQDLQSNSSTPLPASKSSGQRVGGGGLIRKPERNQGNNGGGSSTMVHQHQPLSIGGDQSQMMAISNKPRTNYSTTKIGSGIQQKEINTNINQISSANNIQVYPQTATNQKSNLDSAFTAPGESANQQNQNYRQGVESQQPSPRESGSKLQYIPPITTGQAINSIYQQNTGERKEGYENREEEQHYDVVNNKMAMMGTADYDNDTMISNSQSKQQQQYLQQDISSPDAHNYSQQVDQQQYMQESSRDDGDHHTMASSLMNSPHATINFNNSARLGQANANGSTDTQNIVASSATKKSGQNHVNINNNASGGNNYNYSLDEQMNSIIHEQIGEDDEERKTPIPQQYRQSSNGQKNNMENGDGASSALDKESLRRPNQFSAMNGNSDIMVVEYKGFNSVMKPKNGNSSLSSQQQQQRVGSGSLNTISVTNNSNHNNNNRNNEHTSSTPTHYDDQSVTLSNNNINTANSIVQQHQHYPLKLKEELSSHTLGGEGEYLTNIPTDSLIKQQSNTPPTHQQQKGNGGSTRLKIDIPNGNQPPMVVSNLHSSMHTPQSQHQQAIPSGLRTSLISTNQQQPIALTNNPQNQIANQQQQMTNGGINFNNKQVKGKSSIRTLIKSAATREQ